LKQAYLRDIFQKASKSVCISDIVVSPSCSINFSCYEDPDDPEPADEGDIQME